MKKKFILLLSIIFIGGMTSAAFAQQESESSIDPTGANLRTQLYQDESNVIPGQCIVKFKGAGSHAMDGCAHCAFVDGSFESISTAESDSVDLLIEKHNIQSVEALHIKRHGLNAAQAAEKFQNHLQAIQQKHPYRAMRAPQDATIPDLTNTYVVTFSEDHNPKAVCADFKKDPHVEWASPDYKIKTQDFPQDPPDDLHYHITGSLSQPGSWTQPYDDLWGLKSDKLDMEPAWKISLGEDVVVAVVDSGLDYNHEDIVGNVWSNDDEVIGDANGDGFPGVAGVDDDGDGLIDEDSEGCQPNGQNLQGQACTYTNDLVNDDDENNFVDDVMGWDFSNDDNDPLDGHGHGTHVSGTIAAMGNNNLGIIGVAPSAKIMAIKGLTDDGRGSSSGLAKALVYAAENGADVINNSWGCSAGCPSNPLIEEAVRTAYGLGSLVVFAAGNDNLNVAQYSPQNMSETITVASTDENDEKSFFSNYGGWIDVAAPGGGEDNGNGNRIGRNILSLRANGTDMYRDFRSIVFQKYYRSSGTSMASPHVAGLGALMIGAHPDFSLKEIQSVLRFSADDTGPVGFDAETGYGRIDAAQALSVNDPCVASIVSPEPDKFFTDTTPISIRGTANCRNFLSYTLEAGQGISPQNWQTIFSGNTPTQDGLLGTWDVSSITGEGVYTIRLTVKNVNNEVFQASRQVVLLFELHSGWPVEFGFFESPAALADLDGDGLQDIILTVADPDLTVALRHDGTMLPGWPIDWRALGNGWGTDPSIADIDGDGQMEVVLGPSFSFVYAFNHDGTIVDGWPYDLTKATAEPGGFQSAQGTLISDLDNDGNMEIVVSAYGTGKVAYIHVFNANGKIKPNWPQKLPVAVTNNGTTRINIASADMTGDGYKEIVVLYTMKVFSTLPAETQILIFDRNGQILPGWPVPLATNESVGPMKNLPLVDLTGDGIPEVIFETSRLERNPTFFHKTIHALQADGTYAPGWPVNADFLFPNGYGALTNPIVGDLNMDGQPEIAISARFGLINGGAIAVFQSDGTLFPGWPVEVDFDPVAPLIADVDGDGFPDLVGGGKDSTYALDRNGKMLPGWPKYMSGYSVYSPTIGDVDGDGKLEFLVGGGLFTSLLLYDLEGPADPRTLQWPMLMHDPQKTGLFEPIKPPVPDIKINGLDHAGTVNNTLPLNVTISIDPGDRAGEQSDLWVAAMTPVGFMWLTPNGWVVSNQPVRFLNFNFPLTEVNSFPVMSNATNLPKGAYTFFFGFDLKADGVFDTDPSIFFLDAASVTLD